MRKILGILGILVLMLTSIGCDNSIRNKGIIKFVNRRIEGRIVAMLDRGLTPAILQDNRLIICRDRKCSKQQMEFDFPGKYVKFYYQQYSWGEYTDIITIISNDGESTYLSAFGCNLPTEYEQSKPSHINKQSYVKIFESKIDVSRVVCLASRENQKDIWIVQSLDLKKVYFIDVLGKVISKYEYNEKAIINLYFDEKKRQPSFFGFNGRDIILFKYDKGNISVESRMPSGLNVPNEMLFEENAQMPGFGNDVVERYICVTDGYTVVYVDSLTRNIALKTCLPNVRIGFSNQYLFSDNGCFHLRRTDSKSREIGMDKLCDSDYKPIWFWCTIGGGTQDLCFTASGSSRTDFFFISKNGIFQIETLLDKRHIITDLVDNIEMISPSGFVGGEFQNFDYFYTNDSTYSLEEITDYKQ